MLRQSRCSGRLAERPPRGEFLKGRSLPYMKTALTLLRRRHFSARVIDRNGETETRFVLSNAFRQTLEEKDRLSAEERLIGGSCARTQFPQKFLSCAPRDSVKFISGN